MSDRYEREAAQAAINTLQRTLIRVVKQRDELVRAIREHKAAVAFTLSDCDALLYKALEEVEEGGAA